MTLTQIEYILAVAKFKSFHKAARFCHVTQPTLSMQIKKLEESLGVDIFDRNKTPIQLTKIGSKIVEQAEYAYKEFLKITTTIQNFKGEVEGELRVGVIPTVLPYILPLFLKNFHTQYHKVHLSIFEYTTQNCINALVNDNIDVAILATKEKLKNLVQSKLYDEDLVLYVNPNNKFFTATSINLEDLEPEETWLLEEGHCLRNEIIKLCGFKKFLSKKFPQNLNLKTGSLETLKHLVDDFFGYTFMPALSIIRMQDVNDINKIKRKLNPKPKRTIYLSYIKNTIKTRIIDAFNVVIKSSLREKNLQEYINIAD